MGRARRSFVLLKRCHEKGTGCADLATQGRVRATAARKPGSIALVSSGYIPECSQTANSKVFLRYPSKVLNLSSDFKEKDTCTVITPVLN